MAEIKDVTIRMVKGTDLNALVEIDGKLLGQKRPEFWQSKLELLEHHPSIASLVAEADGKVVGYITGDASGWEFGIPNTVCWFDTIGVEPAYQNRGIASELLQAMVANLKKVGVTKVYTVVNWRDGELLKFLDKAGFTRGDMINLELNV